MARFNRLQKHDKFGYFSGTNPATTTPGAPGAIRGASGGILFNMAGLPPFLQVLQGMRPPGPGKALKLQEQNPWFDK